MLSGFGVLFSLVGVVLTSSSPSPFIMWVGMEITTFFFISSMFISNSMVSASWKYFITQGIASFFLFWGWVIDDISSNGDYFLVLLSLMIKLGVFPYSGWSMNMSENLSWWVFFLLGSVQKIPPLIVVSKLASVNSHVVLLLGVASAGSLIFFFFSNYSIRWMMMFSSLFNLSWLVMGSSLGVSVMMTYMMVYYLFNFLAIFILSEEKFDQLSSSLKTRSVLWEENFTAILSFLFLMGMPPVGTFLGKVEILLGVVSEGGSMISIFLVLASTVVVFFYLKITYVKGVMMPSSWIDSLPSKSALSLIFLSLFSFYIMV